MSIFSTIKAKLFGTPRPINRDELRQIVEDESLWTDETPEHEPREPEAIISEAQRALYAEIENFRKGNQ